MAKCIGLMEVIIKVNGEKVFNKEKELFIYKIDAIDTNININNEQLTKNRE